MSFNIANTLRWIGRHRWFIVIIVIIIMLAPLPAAAETNSEIIAILNASIDGLFKLTKLAYCGAGVTALC